MGGKRVSTIPERNFGSFMYERGDKLFSLFLPDCSRYQMRLKSATNWGEWRTQKMSSTAKCRTMKSVNHICRFYPFQPLPGQAMPSHAIHRTLGWNTCNGHSGGIFSPSLSVISANDGDNWGSDSGDFSQPVGSTFCVSCPSCFGCRSVGS